MISITRVLKTKDLNPVLTQCLHTFSRVKLNGTDNCVLVRNLGFARSKEWNGQLVLGCESTLLG